MEGTWRGILVVIQHAMRSEEAARWRRRDDKRGVSRAGCVRSLGEVMVESVRDNVIDKKYANLFRRW